MCAAKLATKATMQKKYHDRQHGIQNEPEVWRSLMLARLLKTEIVEIEDSHAQDALCVSETNSFVIIDTADAIPLTQALNKTKCYD